MLRVGLTGGIGTGKTTVAQMFQEMGCHVIDSDSITADLYKSGQPINAAVIAAFGPAVIARDGSIDRKTLGELVFSDEKLRRRLNGIVHPAIQQRQKEFLDALATREPNAIGIVEATLMVEAGTYSDYDKLVVVVSSPELQLDRIQGRSGLTKKQIESRIASQMPAAEKAKFADYIIENSNDIEDTRSQVEEIYRQLHALALTRSDETSKRD
jgi:dephospho-CoA kinase